MNIKELQSIIPSVFADDSRVWIYQCNRPFTDKETMEINEQLRQFYTQWMSHDEPVKGWATVLFNRYIVIMADENVVKLGGCSTDDSMKVIKSFERQYQVILFDRLSFTFLVKDKTEMLPMNQLQYAIDNNFINKDTLFFNNTVGTKKELLEKWLIPIGESWIASRVKF